MSGPSDTASVGPDILTLTGAEAARFVGVSRAHWYRLVSSGRAPGPIRLGRSVRWSVEEFRAWIAAGAPVRARWEVIRSRARKA